MKETVSIESLLPVHDTAVERALLASMLTFPAGIPDIEEHIDADCFYDPDNRDIYTAVMDIYRAGEIPDIVSVPVRLAKNGSKVTGIDLMAMVVDAPPTVNLLPTALTLKEYSIRRKLYRTGCRMMTDATNLSLDIETVHGEAYESVESIIGEGSSPTLNLAGTWDKMLARAIDRSSRPEGEIEGTPTGFPEIDKDGGLCEGDLTIVGAETSQGKTSFATAMTLAAINHGDAVAFYSMEMTAEQLTCRIAAMTSGIRSSRIARQRLTEGEIRHIMDTRLSPEVMKNLIFDEKSNANLENLLLSIRRLHKKYGIKGAVVDYLQLVDVSGNSLNPEQRAAICARKLKNIAKELGIWIIAISQLRREPTNPVPSMSRLRSSGQIEEAADNILLIYRPQKGQTFPDPFKAVATEGTAMVMIAKGRHVGTSEFICGFSPDNTLFYPLSPQELEELTISQSFGSYIRLSNKEPF